MKAIVLSAALFFALSAHGSNKVGNGDDGIDLEGVRPVTEGPLLASREKAVALLQQLGTAGVPGLGTLLPEVAHAELYLAKKDVRAGLPDESAPDAGTYHTSMNGFVYARTFPNAHAATRFFPVALELSQAQLVALHIHEGLHRALPLTVREDEEAVAAITLSLTSPDATNDRLRTILSRYVSDADLELSAMGGERIAGGSASAPKALVEEEHFKQPSSVSYAFRQFWKPNQPATYPISNMHVVSSDLYPFGGTNTPFGLGLQASLIDGPGGNQAGPLGISANLKVWSHRDFSVSLWAQADLNVLSADELKNSPFGRDVYALGVSLRKDLRRFYVENFLSFDFPGESTQTVGMVSYNYAYGSVLDAKVRAGARVWKLDAGGFVELHLADYFRVSGGAFTASEGDFGRYRILSAGPELSYVDEDFAVSLQARWLLDSTKGANFDFLGNIMGPGVSQGSIGLSGKVFF